MYLTLNQLAPVSEGIEIGVGESVVIKAMADAYGRTVKVIKAEYLAAFSSTTGGGGDDPLAIHAVTTPTNDLRVKTRRESAGGEKDGGSAGGSGQRPGISFPYNAVHS